MTLMKSKTTRRSQPMIRSRLRSPTSKSITTVRCPRKAKPAAKAAELVVLPTPPLPDVITTTFAKVPLPPKLSPGGGRCWLCIVQRDRSGAQPPLRTDPPASFGCRLASDDRQGIVNQRDLRRAALIFRRQLFADQIAPRYADQLGFEPSTEDSGSRVARGAGQRPAAKPAVNMDIAVRHYLGARADRGRHDQIAAAGIDLGTGADRLGHDPGRCPRGRRRGRGFGRRRRIGSRRIGLW